MKVNLKSGAIRGVLFQVTWFATIALASQERAHLAALPGVLYMLLFLASQPREAHSLTELSLQSSVLWGGGGICLGYLCEFILISGGVFIPRESSILIVPAWLLSLWGSIYLLLPSSMAWVLRTPLIAVCFGALGAPMSYLAGARMGAMHLGGDEFIVGLYTGLAWGVTMGFTSLVWRAFNKEVGL